MTLMCLKIVELFFDNSDGRWGAKVRRKSESNFGGLVLTSIETFDEIKARKFFESEVKTAKSFVNKNKK